MVLILVPAKEVNLPTLEETEAVTSWEKGS